MRIKNTTIIYLHLTEAEITRVMKGIDVIRSSEIPSDEIKIFTEIGQAINEWKVDRPY